MGTDGEVQLEMTLDGDEAGAWIIIGRELICRLPLPPPPAEMILRDKPYIVVQMFAVAVQIDVDEGESGKIHHKKKRKKRKEKKRI